METASWDKYYYASVGESVKDKLTDTLIIYARSDSPVDVYTYMVNDEQNIKALGVNTTHGSTSASCDAGVIVQYNIMEETIRQQAYEDTEASAYLPINITSCIEEGRKFSQLSNSETTDISINQDGAFTANFVTDSYTVKDIDIDVKISLNKKYFLTILE